MLWPSMKRIQVMISSFSEQVWPLLKGQTSPREQAGGPGCGRVIQQVTAASLQPPCRKAQEAQFLREVSEERDHIPSCPCCLPQGEFFVFPVRRKISYLDSHQSSNSNLNLIMQHDIFSFIMRTDNMHAPTLFLFLVRCWGCCELRSPGIWGP